MAKRTRFEDEKYTAAIRDWARLGAESRYALPRRTRWWHGRERQPDAAMAAAHFELGQHLLGQGDVAGSQHHWRAAHRLQPDNWTYKRQAWQLLDPGVQGRSDVYDSSLTDDLKALGPENFYPAFED